MRIIKKNKRRRIGSFVLEASIATPFLVILLAAMLSSMTAVNSDLYVQRATENVVQEINIAIPIASQGFSCVDDVAKAFGLGDLVDVDTKDIDSFLGAFGAVSGATDVDFEDVIGTVAFGRLVRDRIVNEYHKICKNNWVCTELLKTMSVYLDYNKEAKCIFVDVYYDLAAGKVSLSRTYSTSVAMYADPIKRAEQDSDSEEKDDSIWDKDNFERGVALRKKYGGNLPHNYPVISRFEDHEATSIKSIDTTSPFYQNLNKLKSVVKGYIDDLADFNGASWGDTTISGDDIHSRRLIIVLPENGSAECKAQIEALRSYAESRGVKLQIETYGVSHRYSQEPVEQASI